MIAAQNCKEGEQGFTVLEFMLALTLLSALTITLFGYLKFSMTALRQSQQHVETSSTILFAQETIRRLIEEAYPIVEKIDGRKFRVLFFGNNQSIHFLSTAPLALAAGGRMKYDIDLVHQAGKSELVLEAKPELEAETAPRRRLLLSGLASLQISYLDGRAAETDPRRWRDVWSDQSGMPKLIRIRASFLDEKDERWPELIIKPRTSVDVGCVYDPLSKHCRGR
jgi:type II secretory pathway component PulJ